MLKAQTLGTQKPAQEGEEEREGSEKDEADYKTTGTTNGFGFRGGGKGRKPTLRIWKGPCKRREAAKTTNNEGQKAARNDGERNRSKPDLYGHNIIVIQPSPRRGDKKEILQVENGGENNSNLPDNGEEPQQEK